MHPSLILLLSYLLVCAMRYLLQWINIRHLRRYGGTVPAGFEDVLDGEALSRASAYTIAKDRLDLRETLCADLLVVWFFFGGLLQWYDRFVSSSGGGFVTTAILYLLGLAVITTLLSVPFDLYRTFRLESRFGFNTTTPRLWVEDLLKTLVITLVLMTIIAASAAWLVGATPRYWWFWVWVFFAFLTLFLVILSPYVIEPLFFKFEPLDDQELEEEVRGVVARAGLRVDRIMKVDASRRSRHSNAYFTGIGRVKKIVLYDTLLERMNRKEVAAVLAHEIGHWQQGHVWKRLGVSQAMVLAGCYVAYRLITWGKIPDLVGLAELSFFGQLTVIVFIFSIVGFATTPLSSWWSRVHEREADSFAVRVGAEPEALANALKRLSADNLANLHPHPAYARFYYSHPPVVERVERLRA